ncbi:hypothetical protein [Lactobacillus gallinarum]|uniref:hypothetical protein n=1 Tax=Lactobacillus gallinarum TaxID=52242 RepID=UPI0024B9DC86|nr:hypothetical protein [Lactobacillus gallinarum]
MLKNKLIKALIATTFAVIGVGITETVNSSNTTVQASTFHYLRKDHKLVTLGLGENLPVRNYAHGKLVQKDDPKDENTYCDSITPLKTRGWKYINGTKYYSIPSQRHIGTTSAYIATKYFTKKYNNMSYLTVYRVNKKIKALADDMQKTDDGMWYGKGDIILVNNFSLWNHDKYVDTITPMWDGKHNAMKMYDYTEGNFGGELTPSDFKKYCSKAGKNVKFLMNHGKDWYTNSSLARNGMYRNGHFYKVYSR